MCGNVGAASAPSTAPPDNPERCHYLTGRVQRPRLQHLQTAPIQLVGTHLRGVRGHLGEMSLPVTRVTRGPITRFAERNGYSSKLAALFCPTLLHRDCYDIVQDAGSSDFSSSTGASHDQRISAVTT